MSEEDPVTPQEEVREEIETEVPAQEDQVLEQEPAQDKQVPLSALQKERKRRQELEQELYWERQRIQNAQKEVESQDDSSRYESATREDLAKARNETLRDLEERMWIRANPDKFEFVNEQLPKLLQQRPNLVSAINGSQNRYEEALILMNAYNPRPSAVQKPLVKRDAPNGPASIPKGAAMNQAVDVMTMSDKEYSSWRQMQKRRR